jgi:hypothetical protein
MAVEMDGVVCVEEGEVLDYEVDPLYRVRLGPGAIGRGKKTGNLTSFITVIFFVFNKEGKVETPFVISVRVGAAQSTSSRCVLMAQW